MEFGEVGALAGMLGMGMHCEILSDLYRLQW